MPSRSSAVAQYDRPMRPAPDRIERLPQQYFTALLARVSAAAALDGEPLVDLGRGNPEVGPPQHVIDAFGGGGERAFRARVPAVSGVARAARGDCGALLRALRRRARPPLRGHDHAGDEDCDLRARARAGRARVDDRSPRPVLPRLPLRACARRGSDRVRAAGSLGGLGARLRRRTARRCLRDLPELPLEPLRGLRARGDVRRGRRVRARDRRRGHPRLRLRRHRLRRARAVLVPGRAGRARGRRRDVLDVEDLRDGRLAARLRRRQRRDRGAARPARRPRARRDLRAGAAARGSRR